MNGCKHCDDTGIYARPNGPDDADVEFCDCPLGESKRRAILIALQEAYCTKHNIPNFTAKDGCCIYCCKDIVSERFIDTHITGCPKCLKSYCD